MKTSIGTIWTILFVLLTSIAFAAYGPGDYSSSTSTTTTTTSSGGGGGGGGGTTAGEASLDLTTAGTSISLTLSKNQKFTVNHELGQYRYKVESVTSGVVKVQSLETFETTYLFISVPKRFDYNADGKDDVAMILEGVSGSKAVVTVKSVLSVERPTILPIGTNVKERPAEEPAPEPAPEVVQTTEATVSEEVADSNVPPITGMAASDSESKPFDFSVFTQMPVIVAVALIGILIACMAMLWLPARKKEP